MDVLRGSGQEVKIRGSPVEQKGHKSPVSPLEPPSYGTLSTACSFTSRWGSSKDVKPIVQMVKHGNTPLLIWIAPKYLDRTEV